MTYGRLEDTFRHSPKVARLARTLGVRRAEARGLLTGLWSAILLHAPDGDLTDFEPAEIEELADWEGAPGALLAALQDPRHLFIETSRRGVRNGAAPRLYVHDWEEHAEGLKKRAWKQAERQRKAAVSRDNDSTGRRNGEDSRARGSDLDPRSDDLETRGEEQERAHGDDAGAEAEPAADRGPPPAPEPLTLLPSEPPPTPPVAVVTFPASGRPRTWELTPEFLAELQAHFPGVDVKKELELAASKARTGALRSVPTAKGYPRFCWSWLRRSNDESQTPSSNPPSRSAPPPPRPSLPATRLHARTCQCPACREQRRTSPGGAA